MTSESETGPGSVPTVAGPALSVDSGTLVDGHAHAWIDPPAGVAPEHAMRLADEEFQAAALAAWARAAERWAAGRVVGTQSRVGVHRGTWSVGLIDCQPPFAGRDANALAAVSRRAAVAIACVTGFHMARYYAAGRRPWVNTAEAAALFEKEVTAGLGELPGSRAAAIKAGYSGDVAADLLEWEAVVEAQRRTGASLLIHTERGAKVTELLAWLADRGVGANSVYLCHMDKRPDLALHVELAEAGVLLGYDTFCRPHYHPEERVWPLLAGMVEKGLGSAVAVCLDLADPQLWRVPNPGPSGFVEVVARRLASLVTAESELAGLLGGNLLHRLAGASRRGTRPSGARHGGSQRGARA